MKSRIKQSNKKNERIKINMERVEEPVRKGRVSYMLETQISNTERQKTGKYLNLGTRC